MFTLTKTWNFVMLEKQFMNQRPCVVIFVLKMVHLSYVIVGIVEKQLTISVQIRKAGILIG